MNTQLYHASFSLVNVKSIIRGFNYSELTSLVYTLGLEYIFYNTRRNYLKICMLILRNQFS